MQVVTANRLIDGRVVYLGLRGDWSERLAEARTADTQAEAEALLAAAEQAVRERQVVAPYLIDVTAAGGVVRPQRYREAIRETGPSVRPDLCREPAKG